MRTSFLISTLCTIMSLSVTAQSIYYNYEQENVVRLEFNKPIFKENFVDFNFLTFDAYLNGEFKIGESNKIAVEVPFTRVSFEGFNGPNQSENNLGNMSIAYQMRDLYSPSYVELKFRIPTGSDDLFFGIASDYTERVTAIALSAWSFEPSYLFESDLGGGGYFRIKPGGKLLYDIDNSDDDFEALLDLSGLIGYRNKTLDINGGISSTTILTEEGDFSERSLWQAFATVTYKANQFEPGLIFRLPLDESFLDAYSFIVGIQLGYRFGGGNNDIPLDEN